MCRLKSFLKVWSNTNLFWVEAEPWQSNSTWTRSNSCLWTLLFQAERTWNV